MISFSDIMNFVKEYDNKNNTKIENRIKDHKIGLILNQFRWQVDKNFGRKITNICNKHLYFGYYFLGNISSDSKIGDANMKNKVFVNDYDYSKTAAEIHTIARAVADQPHKDSVSLPLVS